MLRRQFGARIAKRLVQISRPPANFFRAPISSCQHTFDSSRFIRDMTTFAGPKAPSLLQSTIGDRFDYVCRAHPDQLALVSLAEDIRWSYKDVETRVYACVDAPLDGTSIW